MQNIGSVPVKKVWKNDTGIRKDMLLQKVQPKTNSNDRMKDDKIAYFNVRWKTRSLV